MVRRFDVYCNGGWDGCTTYEDDDERGDYVSYSDYAELQEAVRRERAAFVAWAEKGGASYPDWAEGRDAYDAARAAVDALVGEG